jgi:protein-L-isoaspartate(D-aspartate) O-methyltransferase
MDALGRMIETQIEQRGVRTLSVLRALWQVPRERFVPAELRQEAYEDEPLPIGFGQTISQPYMVALMTEALDVQVTHRVLEIGAGSGYQTAILAKLAKWVYAIERVPELAAGAKARLTEMGIANVTLRDGDGTLGWADEAPFDRLLIAAAAPEPPRRLMLSQLAEGGVAVLPAGGAYDQQLLRFVRRGHELRESLICGCRFVKLVGEEGWASADEG